jgi:hypothetical protein
MRKTSLLFLVAVFTVFSGANLAQSASLYMDPAFSSIGRGDAIAVSVRLDTDEANDECINAVNAVIKYSENVIPADVSIGDSILRLILSIELLPSPAVFPMVIVVAWLAIRV